MSNTHSTSKGQEVSEGLKIVFGSADLKHWDGAELSDVEKEKILDLVKSNGICSCGINPQLTGIAITFPFSDKLTETVL